MPGTLIMAATDLGNRADLPARSLAALKETAVLVFEEARQARQFLKTAGIHRDFLLFSEHRQKETLEQVRKSLDKGDNVLYMSDQGTPNVADPGESLLKIAFQLGAPVKVIPGPSAITTSLSACPFKTEPFYYCGFLPREESDRQRKLKELSKLREAIVLLDTPYRREALLSSLAKVLPKRKALLALDISGPKEGFYFDSANRLQKIEKGNKLNFVLVIAPLS